MRGNFFYGRLGKCIAAARGKNRLSQEEISHLCGVDRTYFARIEEGKANPSIKVLCKIARVLKMKLWRLIRNL